VISCLAEHRPPGGGFQNVDVVVGFAVQLGNAFENAFQLREHCQEQVFAAEIGDGALFDLAIFAKGFDNAEVFVDGTIRGGHADGADYMAVASVRTENQGRGVGALAGRSKKVALRPIDMHRQAPVARSDPQPRSNSRQKKAVAVDGDRRAHRQVQPRRRPAVTDSRATSSKAAVGCNGRFASPAPSVLTR